MGLPDLAWQGGFKKNKTSAASILDVQQGQDKKGKDYYKYELLVRSGAPPPCCRCTALQASQRVGAGSAGHAAACRMHAPARSQGLRVAEQRLSGCLAAQPTATREAATS